MSISRALISVSDKTGLEDLARGLHEHEIEILSTGGTAKFIADLDIPVVEVSDFTGFPELFDGRVKTLHPKVHGGLLHRRDLDEHVQQAVENDILPIDLVVVNLYPFEDTERKTKSLVPRQLNKLISEARACFARQRKTMMLSQ